ncbi:MAG: WG repeat-containing protein [Candidatus Fibromonas sp.]|jgi:uncharacterized protein (TIGR02145 family)|nr:WG repeat-containing protein [Candidatus Fibromonas sp.]
MKKGKLAFIAAVAALLFACESKTGEDFSIVPIKGANGEYQYIDLSKKGRIVINPQFGEAHIFKDGLALVKASGQEGKWGYIDNKGKFIIAPVYSKAQSFSEEVAWVQMEGQPPMLIDKKGKVILQIDSLIAATPFKEGIAALEVYGRGTETGIFIDKNGTSAAAVTKGEKIGVFSNGFYAFKNAAIDKWGYKNMNGETVINQQFEEASPFADEMAAVKVGNKWGVIDIGGNFIINPQYDSLHYDCDGLFTAQAGKKYGWVNKKSEIIINPQYDSLAEFAGNKLAAVKMGNKWAYIDRKGEIKINPQFSVAYSFDGNWAKVASNDGKIGFINNKGEFIVPPLYENAFSIEDDRFSSYEKLKEKRMIYARGSFVDLRDSSEYKTIKIGKQTWMAQNLNYRGEDGYLGLCYGDEPRKQIFNPENCEKYGRLYDWSEAMGLDRTYNRKQFGNSEEKVQGACPEGWHLPSSEEWQILKEFVGFTTAGKQLKAASGWDKNGNGIDDYGFTALPGGRYDKGFSEIGTEGDWWTSTEQNVYNARRRRLSHDMDFLYETNLSKTFMYSIRCVQDLK